jgi:hypothetical protein
MLLEKQTNPKQKFTFKNIMDIFGKKEMKSLSALKGVKAADVTAEQLDAVNADLKELGIEGIEVSEAGRLQSVNAELDTAKGELKTATDKNTANAETIKNQAVKITELEGKLSNMQAEKPKEAEAKEDKISSEGSPDALVSSLNEKMEKDMGLS